MFTDEQNQFRDALRRFFTDVSPTSAVRRAMATERGFDPDVWRQACADLGLAGIHVPERYGGLGAGFTELGIALEEMGRALWCAPFFSSAVLATTAILHGATETFRARLLPAIAVGETIATLAFVDESGDWDPTAAPLRAHEHGDGFLLEGVRSFVLDGANADVIVCVARIDGGRGLSLFLVEHGAPGLSRRSLDVLDPTRRQAAITFDSVPAVLISDADAAGPAVARTLALGAIALANEMAGGCQIVLDMTVEYAKLRMQFGRPIGSFQAVKHRAANMLLDVEHARSAAYHAAAAVDAGDAEVPALAALAKAVASDAYRETTAACIQLHGGIGFTWDHDAHLWFKRAKSSEMLLGSPDEHREYYMTLLEARA